VSHHRANDVLSAWWLNWKGHLKLFPSDGRMTSEMGQSRRFDCVPPTSPLPPSTDIVRSARQVRFVPRREVQPNCGSQG
jgi:hypothetical protein